MNRLAIASKQLAELGSSLYRRGWMLGTSGNFSVVLERDPLRLAMTPSGADKGALSEQDLLEVDAEGRVLSGTGRPSAEAALHMVVIRDRGAGAVLHTHSVAASVVSERHGDAGGISFEGHEMVKGLAGVTTHAHREWLPILANSQDYAALSRELADTLQGNPACHGFLLRRHGLYTWGSDLAEARRHLEILEYLLEVMR